MLFNRKRVIAAVALPAVLAGVIGLTMAGPAQAAPSAPADIVDQLKAVPGLTLDAETEPPAPGYRLFFLHYTQPVDHHNPGAGSFQQRFQLLHKATDRPMVLHTTGYNMPDYGFRSEPTKIIDGNQISVEQRFFSPSRPDPADWSKLDIWQAATDHHRIVSALKPIYSKNWISTGASKGGMTSVYHRRFYPGDVQGVAAYVAPMDTINSEDSRYDKFFSSVGTDPACRTALADFQIEALHRRAEMVDRYQHFVDEKKLHFTQIFGTADKAFEMVVEDTVWAFWQYHLQAECPKVPATNAPTDAFWAFMDEIAGFEFYTDEGLLPYAPYFYQAATQLGWPSLKFKHLRGEMHYPGLYQANSSLPADLRRSHQALPMIDVDHWVRHEASQMLFVYGGSDPWGAEQFVPSRNDSYSYTVAGGNHGSKIAGLAPDDKAAATAELLRWAGVGSTTSVQSAESTGALNELDRRDPDLQRRPL